MNPNGILKQHWLHVAFHFVVDAVIFAVAFVIGTDFVISDDDLHMRLASYVPGILLGAFIFPCLVYIFGLYSPQSYKQRVTKRAIVLGICLIGTVLLVIPLFYLKKSTNIGREVFLYSVAIVYPTVLIHHGMLLRSLRNYRERVAFIMTCTFDELEARFFQSLGTENMELVGLIHYDNYQPIGEMRVLGKVSDLQDIIRRENIHRVLCTSKSISDPAMCKAFCELRYSGVQVMPLVSVFEEVHQLVPLELITPEWLLAASAQPHMLYIKKVKRAFDIVVSLLGLVFLGPVMVLGIFWTRTTRKAAVAGMLTGLGLTIYYMARNAAPVVSALGLTGNGLWFGIQPVSAGVFGVFAGALVTVLVSLGSEARPARSDRDRRGSSNGI